MDPFSVKAAVDELTNKTLPELLAIATALLDRAEKLIEHLDGATITIRLKQEEPTQ